MACHCPPNCERLSIHLVAHQRLDGAGTAVKGRDGIPVLTVGKVTMGNTGRKSGVTAGGNCPVLVSPVFGSGSGGGRYGKTGTGGGDPGDTLS